MLRTAQKEFKWEMAHRLTYGYPGNCQHLHGHSYVATVKLGLRSGEKLDEFGFVKDYHDFKPLKNWIDDQLDHATMVCKDDVALLGFLSQENNRMFVTEINPSAEHICELLFHKANEFLADQRTVVLEVKVNETCTSEATLRRNHETPDLGTAD
jgi:6-pyruvoyl tetrahydropterin synthase/QueD family protein